MLGAWLATRLAMVGRFGIPDEDRLLLVIERIAPAEQGIDDTLDRWTAGRCQPIPMAAVADEGSHGPAHRHIGKLRATAMIVDEQT